MFRTRLPTRVGVLLSLVLLLAGCGQTRVRVLNDLTNEPVAGATITPFVNNFFGTPSESRHVQTDQNGYATIPHGGVHSLHADFPSLRQVNSDDKPPFPGQVKLLYLRPVPRVVLVLPPDYAGPVLVAANRSTAEQRDPVYRVPAGNDPLRPVEVPSIDERGTRPGEIEVEQDGRLVTPGRRGTDDGGGVHLWVPDASPFPSQNAYVNALYVGRLTAFDAFERALQAHQVGQGGMARLDRDALRVMAVAAETAGE